MVNIVRPIYACPEPQRFPWRRFVLASAGVICLWGSGFIAALALT